jgi:hypothetical protein
MTGLVQTRQFFVDRDYDFALPIGRLQELEAFCDMGVELIWRRLSSGLGTIRETKEVLRLGLIGPESLDPEIAFRLVERGVVSGKVIETARLASVVLGAALVGAPGDDLGEPLGAAAKKSRRSRKAEPDGAASLS